MRFRFLVLAAVFAFGGLLGWLLSNASVSTPMVAAQATTKDKPITGTIKAPFGEINLEKGLPATELDSKKLYDELDFQRACQTYLWALPLVSFAEWQHQHETVFGAKDGQLVEYDLYKDRLGILTANATTPYTIAFGNLARTGPMILDVPEGPLAGQFSDFWQRGVGEVGESALEKGNPAKYLILGPGQDKAKIEGYRVVRMPTNNFMIGVRSLEPDMEKSKVLMAKLALYPFANRDKPPANKLISPEGKEWNQGQPRGLAYWQRLHAILQEEPVEPRDRMMMAMLVPLGIEKGKPFTPDERQKKILIQGAEIGELMAMNFSFHKRFEGIRYRPDTAWVYALRMKSPSQEDEHFTQLDHRTAWFYEAVTSSKGMLTTTPGEGQAYLGAYHDKAGKWFDGGKTYRLRVPPDPPAKQFWSWTLYDTRTRCLIINKQGIADRSSRMDLKKNADGSIDLYMGPTAPEGLEKNWIPTNPDQAWFAYFRLFAPLKPYFDQSWLLPDIEMVK